MTGNWLLGLLVVLGSWSESGVQVVDTVEGRISFQGMPATGAVVYLEHGTSAFAASADTVVLDQRGLRFLPGTLAVGRGTTVAFLNNDDIQHNIFSPGEVIGTGDPFDLGTYSRGEKRFHTFPDLGVHTILCNVHPEMLAYVVSVPTEYRAVTDPDGRFSIPDVPLGTYRLRVWHPLSSQVDQEVRVDSEMGPLNITLELED